jgi:hypothetical protein
VRSLALAVGVGLLATACAEEAEREPEPPAQSGTELTITVWHEGREAGSARLWTLRCDPPGGTHPAPEAACRALAASPEALDPVPPDVVCAQVYGGPQVARVTGVYRGRRIAASFDRTNSCEIGRWNALVALFPLQA